MRIIELLKNKKFFVSLEFFPPKDKALWPEFFKTIEKLRVIDPAFVSVTYGAFGSTQDYTKEITIRLKRDSGLEPMAHLTCVGASKENVRSFLESLFLNNVDNILALRGDPPEEGEVISELSEFNYASDLVSFIRKDCFDCGIAVAGYPEGHPEAKGADEDLKFLKFKLDKGADFVITQLFFDNNIYWDFVSRARAIGIDKPIIPGILPVAGLKGLKSILSKCGASIPDTFLKNLHAAHEKGGKEAVQALGIEHAVRQARGLMDKGAPGLHFYTLNRAKTCLEIFEALGLGKG